MAATTKSIYMSSDVSKLLVDANRLAQQGDRQDAYRLSLQATRLEPDNPEAWVLRSKLAATNEERLFCLSQVHRINPHHPIVKRDSYQVIWHMLQKDPFLAYLNETDDLYYVRSNAYLSIPVPKDRAMPETYPPKEPSKIAPAFHYLGLALLGLMFAGLGTLIFAPLAIIAVMSAASQQLSSADRVRARIVVLTALVLIVGAIGLVWLLISHFIG
ncbi:MAG: hypothetical protein ACM3PY_19595 [Omnitrophica WOR_2 bacterium]